jgi:hypothetical protein
MIPGLRTYPANPAARRPLIEFMTEALTATNCKLIHRSPPDRAPFVVVFETPTNERMAIVAYAFLATRTPTKNRPPDEQSFQIKYGSKSSYAADNSHDLWQDPLGMFTTLLVGINPELGICVSAAPVLHSPTKFFIRVEFKDEHVDIVRKRGWHAWERVKRNTPQNAPRVETLVGTTRERFLDLVRFERAARGVDPGNRLILAERFALSFPEPMTQQGVEGAGLMQLAEAHPLVKQFSLSSDEILDLISNARRLKMAVRGWVAEEHLRSRLSKVPGVTHCERLDEEGGPDLRISYRGGPLLTIECKNVARATDKHGNPKIDFQRTRAAKGNFCSRYYEPDEFDIVAACLHAVTNEWDFRYALPTALPAHKVCPGRIASNIRVDKSWFTPPEDVFRLVYSIKGIGS